MRINPIVAALAVVTPALPLTHAFGMSKKRQLELRAQVKESFYHAYNGYMEYAFPFDELNPIACVGRGRDRSDPGNINVNDVLGDYLLTLVDTLDALAVLGDRAAFSRAVEQTIQYLPDFNIDSHVQVFEVTIRMLGGLLSAHIIATDEKDTLGMRLDTDGAYKGELLGLARDLAYRLLPAFEASPNSIPYPRTNLKHGFPRGETPETCAAGIGTLLLEFGTLSRLTNETIFEDIARHALNELWMARSKKNLFGNVFNLESQRWITPIASISAGLDSLYEYMLKGYVYFGDPQYLRTFEVSYSALLQYIRDTVGGYAFFNVDMGSAEVTTTWIDSLSAYFPGLMVLAGDVDGAESAYMLYYHLWRRFRAMPERFNMFVREPDVIFYPLRPEFVESTYFLYRATRDPFYLDVGEMVLADLNALQKTRCGYASMQNVDSHKLEERMESFLLSETFKYLYLLFDDENPLHSLDNNYVFTTEGHVLLPLTPPHTESMQYPNGTSFAKRKLIHSEAPPSAVKPFFYQVDNIRRKLGSVHPDDMFALPVFGDSDSSKDASGGDKLSQHGRNHGQVSGEPRKCPVPRSIGISVEHLVPVAERPNGDSVDEQWADSSSSSSSNSNNISSRSDNGHRSEETSSIPRKDHNATAASPGIKFVAEWRPNHMQSPLAQLYAMRELTRAAYDLTGKSPAQRHYILSLLVNSATPTMPLRSDFYDVGMLVSSNRHKEDAVFAPPAPSKSGTTVLNASLRLGVEYEGMCSLPSHLFLSQRQEVWPSTLLAQVGQESDVYGVKSPPMDAETWLRPNTRQIPFMEFLLSRASKANAMMWSIPHMPRARHGVPLLKDVWDEVPDQPDASHNAPSHQKEQEQEQKNELPKAGERLGEGGAAGRASTTRLKRRGYSPMHGQNGQQQLIITNGAGQVMTEHVIVRVSTDDSLHEFVRALPVHNDSVSSKKARTTTTHSAGSSMPSATHRQAGSDSRKRNNGSRRKAHLRQTGMGVAKASPVALRLADSSKGSTGESGDQGGADTRHSDRDSGEWVVDEGVHTHSHLALQDRHRRRDYAGRLADFAEMSLYRGHSAYLVPDPTTLIMLHLYSSSAAYGCEEYTPREQKMVRGKVVAARVGGGCTVWEKAIHARNAGASALIVDVEEEEVDGEEQQQQHWEADQSQRSRRESEAETGADTKTKTTSKEPPSSAAAAATALGEKEGEVARLSTQAQSHQQRQQLLAGDRQICRRQLHEERKCQPDDQYADAGAPDGGIVAAEGVVGATGGGWLRGLRAGEAGASMPLRQQRPSQWELLQRQLQQERQGHQEANGVRAMAMPVVAVSQGVINEIEEYLISGLHVRVELL